MLTNLSTIADKATFLDTLFNFLVNLETPISKVYLDNATPRIATIGVGFNLTTIASLNAVVTQFGLDPVGNPIDIGIRDQLLNIFIAVWLKIK